MALLPSIASRPSNIADLLSKPLPTITHQRLVSLIGASPTDHPLASATSPSATVAPTVVASAPTLTVSDSVPIVLDTGASYSLTPFASDFLPVAQAPYGLYRSAASLVSDLDFDSKLTSVASKALSASTVDPHALITGEDVSVDPVDLSSADSNSVVEFASTFATQFRKFDSAALVFHCSGFTLIHISVEPDLDRFDWLHWIPLTRLIPPESCFHIFGFDCIQAFALFHLIPICIALVSLIRSE